MDLPDAWESEARNWIAWARTPGHDSYWRFHRDRFLGLLQRIPLFLHFRAVKHQAADGSAP